MSEPTLQELKELMLDLSKQVIALDKKVETGLIKLDAKIEQVETTLTAKIEQVETKLTGEIKRVEETLSAKVDGLDKRLSNEETISRTAFAALVVATLTGLIKYLFFPVV